ncbi:MAG: tetratricopeptide repeat protein [Thermodesulfobacteriota bacterium]
MIFSAFVFYGCMAVEQTPVVEDSFFLERARVIREGAEEALALGHDLRALSMFREAYAIDNTRGTPGDRVSDLIGMGRASAGLDRIPDAERYLTRAVTLSFSSRDEMGLAAAYAALARLYLKTGNTRLAAANITDAIRLHASPGTSYAELLNLAGVIYIEAGRLDEAAGAVETAVRAVEQSAEAKTSPVLADSYRIMAEILARMGRSSEAMLYFTRAYDTDTWLGDDRKRALDIWGYAGLLFDARRYTEAATWLKRSYSLNMKSGYLEGAIRDLDKLVEVYIALGDKRSELYYRTMKEAVLSDMR